MNIFSNRNMDMTHGPIAKKIISFSVPLIFTSLLQCTFNAADSAVVGQFSGSNALAAVGSSSSIINLLVNFFVGLSTGTVIALSHALGADNEKEASEYAHCSILFSIIIGIIISLFSIIYAKNLLVTIGTPLNVLGDAILYFRIYMSGVPVILLYNFSSAIMQTTGDTTRPFVFLFIAGIVNVILNLILVIGFKMGCAGVAIATVVSNFISSFLTVYSLTKINGCCKIFLSKLKIYPKRFIKILYYGVPVGISTSLFSFSNVLYQKAFNSFGSAAVAGNAAAITVESLVGPFANSFGTCALTFAGQNYGARNAERVKKVCIQSHLIAFIFVLCAEIVIYSARKPIIGLFITDSQEAFDIAVLRLRYVLLPFLICMLQTIGTCFLRGIGKAILPMIYSIFFICIVRLIWLYTVFPQWHSIESLYFSYPFTWALNVILLVISEIVTIIQLKKKFSTSLN